MSEELLKAGEKSPDFTLSSHAGAAAGDAEDTITLSDYRGKNVILVFYPADWSAVCGDQLTLYSELLPEFEKYNADLLGISVDGVFCHAAFRENRGYKMTLLSDFEPKGEVSKKYGVYRNGDGFSERALFVIDKDGVIRWSYVSPIGVNPGANQILQSLKEIQAGKDGKGEKANA
ncbi:MAG: redoxin domain-containing protein [Pyrinomonadaceae bacterium]